MQTRFADAAQHADAFFVIRAISSVCVRDMLGVALFWLSSFFSAEKGFAFGKYYFFCNLTFFFLAKLGGWSVRSCSPFCI